jgi:TatD DNase family protein
MAVLFDSHAHINNERYDAAGRAAVIAAVEASDVGYVVDIGFDVASSELAAAHAAAYPWCYAAVGVHPSEVAGMTEESIAALRALATGETSIEGSRHIEGESARQGSHRRSPGNKVVAIGEIGLDYHYDDAPSAEEQRYWFRRQLALGIELGMPVTIHDRESGGETLEILKEGGAFDASRIAAFAQGSAAGAGDGEAASGVSGDDSACTGAGEAASGVGGDDPARGDASAAAPLAADGFPDARILLHCFSGDADEALAAIRLGAWISVAGPVTFKNSGYTSEVARAVPLSRLLIETDAPYLTPVPHRGEPNIPPYVEFTARKIAELRGATYEEVAAATTENAKRFYGITDGAPNPARHRPSETSSSCHCEERSDEAIYFS